MIKNLILIILLLLITISCGKKNCPKYNQEEKCSDFFKIEE